MNVATASPALPARTVRQVDSAVLAALLASGEGQFSRSTAIDHGLDDRHLAALVKGGTLHRVRRGMYVDGAAWGAADEVARHLMRARAVLAATSDDTYLTGVSSLVVRGVELYQADLSTVQVVRLRGSARREAGVLHSDGELPLEHRGEAQGLRAASPAWSLVDYARAAQLGPAVVALDSALRKQLLTRDALEGAAERCRAWSGARAMTRAVGLCDGRAESVGESLSRVVFEELGLPPDDLQMVVSAEDGRFRVDFAWKERRTVGEFDGRLKYQRPIRPEWDAAEVAWQERRRELSIERAGWVVVRFTWTDLRHPELVRSRLLEAFGRATVLRLHSATG